MILILTILAFCSIIWAQQTLMYEVCNSATANWTFTNAGGSMALQQNTYWLLDNSGDIIISEAYNVNNFTSLTLTFKVGTLTSSGGTPHPSKVEYSTDNGASWNASTFTSATPTGVAMSSAGTWNLGTLSTSQLKFKWTFPYTGAQAVRIDEIQLQGSPVSPLLLEENFNYTNGTTLVSNFWSGYNTGNTPTVATTALTYPNYPCVSGYAGQTLGETGQDVSRTFTAQTSGTVYSSFLINVSSASTTADYVFNLAPNPAGISDFKGRVFVQKNASNVIRFGLTKSSDASSAVWTGYSYNHGTTYLIVLKYKINAGAANDNVYMWVNPVITGSEPAAQLTASDVSGADISAIGSVQIRQGTTTPIAYFDGIRVSTDWFFTDITLPIELSSFTANATPHDYVRLNWVTQSETNVLGFYIYRSRTALLTQAGLVSPLIQAGNTSGAAEYSFEDRDITENGDYYYWLQSVDYSGNNDYYGPSLVTIDQGNIPPPVIPIITGLHMPYPNPFNPDLNIAYTVKNQTMVEIGIFNVLGQHVRTVFSGVKAAGNYTLNWDGKDKNGNLAGSGVFIVRMKAEKAVYQQKVILLK